jgi:hypothetical protein
MSERRWLDQNAEDERAIWEVAYRLPSGYCVTWNREGREFTVELHGPGGKVGEPRVGDRDQVLRELGEAARAEAASRTRPGGSTQ